MTYPAAIHISYLAVTVPSRRSTTQDLVGSKRRKELREKDPPRGRIPDLYGAKERMERKLRTKRGRDICSKRGQTVEAVFGQHVTRGRDRFLLRGKKGAKTEWSLFSATHNLLKLWRSGQESDSHVVTNAIAR